MIDKIENEFPCDRRSDRRFKKASKATRKAIADLKEKSSDLINDKVINASYSVNPLSKVSKAENESQFEIEKNLDSNKVNVFLRNATILLFLCIMMLTFRHNIKTFQLKGDTLKMITDNNFNVGSVEDLRYPKLMFEFGRKLNFDGGRVSKKNS